MCNKDIRVAARDAGVRLWRIAQELGMSDGTFSRRLRRELPNKEKERIFSLIQKLSGGDAQ